MSKMTLDDAKRIALNCAWRHSSLTLADAACLLGEAGEPALSQLAQIKAILRANHIECGIRVGN